MRLKLPEDTPLHQVSSGLQLLYEHQHRTDDGWGRPNIVWFTPVEYRSGTIRVGALWDFDPHRGTVVGEWVEVP